MYNTALQREDNIRWQEQHMPTQQLICVQLIEEFLKECLTENDLVRYGCRYLSAWSQPGVMEMDLMNYRTGSHHLHRSSSTL